MAWVLRKRDADEEIKLLANREYVVGRKEVDIILNNDQSISRRHAILTISHHVSNVSSPSSIPSVKLIDTSKYGTSVNEEKIDKSGVIINSGDTILFGILENNWRIEYKPLICTSSFLQKTERTLLRQYLAEIGGHLVSEWTSQCNLLVMSQLNMSIKVVNALSSNCHIVTANFLRDFIDAVEKHSDEPKHKLYIPPLAEPLQQEDADSFIPNGLRSSVFFGVKFLCVSSKQMKKLQFAIEMGGGECHIVESYKESFPTFLKDESVCILQPSTDELKDKFIETLTDNINRHSLRYISEAEIGMAILHCSTEKFCNPRGSGEKEYLLQPLPSQSLSSQFNASAAQSEQMDFSEQVKMESCETNDGSSNSDLQADVTNDPFLKDTLEYPANFGQQKLGKTELFCKKEHSPVEGPMDSLPLPTRLSPDIFGDVSQRPFTTKAVDRADDSCFSPCSSGLQRKANIPRDQEGNRKSVDSANSHDENGNRHSLNHTKPHRQTSQAITLRATADRTDVFRERCMSTTIPPNTPVGFLSSRCLPSIKTGDDSSDNLETSLIIVKFKSLIRKRRAEEEVSVVSNGTSKKNFKKFRKVFPKCGPANVSVVLLRPSNGLTTSVREPNLNEEKETPMNLSPSYSQSQSDNLFNWPTHLS